MGYVTNTAQTTEGIGLLGTIREQLEDVIIICKDVSRPLLKSMMKVPTGSIRHDFLVDDLDFTYTAASLLTGLATEGQDAVFAAETKPTRLFINMQINAEAWDTSGTMRSLVLAGREDEHGYVAFKRTQMMAHKMEMAIHFGTGWFIEGTNNQTPSSTTARRTHGILPWAIVTGLDRLATFPNTQPWPGTGNAATTSAAWTASNAGPLFPSKFGATIMGTNIVAGTGTVATNTALTRNIFKKDILGAWYANDGAIQGSTWIMGPPLRRTVSAFGAPNTSTTTTTITGSSSSVPAGTSTSAATTGLAIPMNYRTVDAQERTLWDTIEALVTDNGIVYVAQDRYMAITDNFSNYYGGGNTIEGGAPDAVSFTWTPYKTMLGFQRGYQRLQVLRGARVKPLAPLGDSDKAQLLCEWGFQPRNPKMLCVATGLTESSGY